MNKTLTYTETLVVLECCNCGAPFGISEWLNRQRRDDGGWLYCPNGHRQCYTVTTEQRLKDAEVKAKKAQVELDRHRILLDQATADADYQRRQREIAERSLYATRGVVTRLKKRTAAGVCPCCNRTFSQLARHMKTQHPGFEAEDPA